MYTHLFLKIITLAHVTLLGGILLALAAAGGLPTREEVDAVIERADARVRATYGDAASDRYSSGRQAVERRGRKITKE